MSGRPSIKIIDEGKRFALDFRMLKSKKFADTQQEKKYHSSKQLEMRVAARKFMKPAAKAFEAAKALFNGEIQKYNKDLETWYFNEDLDASDFPANLTFKLKTVPRGELTISISFSKPPNKKALVKANRVLTKGFQQ